MAPSGCTARTLNSGESCERGRSVRKRPRVGILIFGGFGPSQRGQSRGVWALQRRSGIQCVTRLSGFHAEHLRQKRRHCFGSPVLAVARVSSPSPAPCGRSQSVSSLEDRRAGGPRASRSTDAHLLVCLTRLPALRHAPGLREHRGEVAPEEHEDLLGREWMCVQCEVNGENEREIMAAWREARLSAIFVASPARRGTPQRNLIHSSSLTSRLKMITITVAAIALFPPMNIIFP